MNGSRIRVGLAVVALGVGLSTGTAAANHGCPDSCGSHDRDVLPTSDVQPTSGALPAEEERELAFTDDAPADTLPASQGSLPFTGGDVAGMVLMGAAAVGIGTVMIRRSRTSAAE